MKPLIFIAKDEHDTTVGMVVAGRRHDAEVFWYGKGLKYKDIRTVDPQDINRVTTDLLDLLTTRGHECHVPGAGSQWVVVVEKGAC